MVTKTPAAPAAPDPKETAAAQTQMNKDTAIAQQTLAQTNQITPYGSLVYNKIGEDNGTPRYEAVQTLSPEQQNLYNLGTQTQTNLGNIGVSQSEKIANLLNTPFNVGDARDSKIAQIQQSFLDPQWQRQQGSLETQLINKGVRPGSEAYTRAMSDFSDQRQRGYDQSYLDAYGKAEQSALTERNQPINEITALLSGSQVSQPQFTNTPSAGVAPTDYMGAVQNKYAADLANYNAAQQRNNGALSGLFGLGSAALGGWAYNGFKGL